MSVNKEKTNKNILLYANHISAGGGVERVVVTIGNELINRGHNVTLCVLEGVEETYEFKGEIISIDSSLKKKSSLRSFIALFKRAYKLSWVSKERSINTVISFAETAGLSAVISKLFGNSSKIITSVHNDPYKRMTSNLRFLVRNIYPYANEVVAVSKGVERVLIEKFGLNNTTTIYNGMDIVSAKKEAKKELPKKYSYLKDMDHVVVNIGRFVKQKGQWRLVRAFTEVAKKYPEAKLVILGEGELQEKLQKLITDCGLENNVILTGNQENVFPFLRYANIFASSSISEGFGLVLIESLAVNTPVVSADCDFGPREIIAPDITIDKKLTYPYKTNNGILVSNEDIEEIWWSVDERSLTVTEKQLVESMITVLEHDNFSCSVSDFDNEKIINQWEDLINKNNEI